VPKPSAVLHQRVNGRRTHNPDTHLPSDSCATESTDLIASAV
jgi:hypothetical protein